MIKIGRHINLMLVFAMTLVLFASCKTTENSSTQEENIYTKRNDFKLIFHEANSEKMIGHNETAIALFQKCLVMEPNNHSAHFALADLYQKMGNQEKNLFHAKKAFELNEDNKWYRLYLADLYFGIGEFGKTASLYKSIISEEKNTDLKFNYVDALIRSQRFQEAIDMLDEIEVETGKVPEISFTKHDLYSDLGKPDEATREMNEFLEENPRDPEYKSMAAEFYMQRQKFAESKELIQLILKDDPKFSQAYIMLADIALRQDDVQGAFTNLAKGFAAEDVEIDRKLQILEGLIPYSAPGQRDQELMKNGIENLFSIIYDPTLENVMLHSLYGRYSLLHGDSEKAEEQYSIAVKLDASSFDTWMQLLNANYDLKHYEALHKNGKEAVELFPSQPTVYLLTGIGAKEKGKYEEAEEWFFIGKDLVVQDPSLSSEFLFHLGHMNYLQSNETEGAFYYDQAKTTFPGNSNVYEDMGKRLIEKKEYSAAEEVLSEGLLNSPKSSKLLFQIGKAYFFQEKYKASEEAFLKALFEHESDPAILEGYGDALFKNGDVNKAISFWEESVNKGNTSSLIIRKINDKQYYDK